MSQSLDLCDLYSSVQVREPAYIVIVVGYSNDLKQLNLEHQEPSFICLDVGCVHYQLWLLVQELGCCECVAVLLWLYGGYMPLFLLV